jgi:hypothetical protein
MLGQRRSGRHPDVHLLRSREPCLKQVKAPDDFMVATPAGNGPVRHVDPKDVEVAPVTVNASSWASAGEDSKSVEESRNV